MALVLIVLDEPDTLLRLRRDLETGGHLVVLAADADVALERLATLPVDVVILDVMMPVHDGWTVLATLADRRQPPPAIVISGRASPFDLERAKRMGAVGWLAAPFTPEDTQKAVANALVVASAS